MSLDRTLREVKAVDLKRLSDGMHSALHSGFARMDAES